MSVCNIVTFIETLDYFLIVECKINILSAITKFLDYIFCVYAIYFIILQL